MRILNSYTNKTLDNVTVYCGEMTDGCTWLNIAGESTVYSVIDDLENSDFTIADLHKGKVAELREAPQTLDQFVGHVNSFLDY